MPRSSRQPAVVKATLVSESRFAGAVEYRNHVERVMAQFDTEWRLQGLMSYADALKLLREALWTPKAVLDSRFGGR